MINDELWRAIATGGLDLVLAKMLSITVMDTRARLWDDKDFWGWLRVELADPGSLAFAVNPRVMRLLYLEVKPSTYYDPALQEQEIPMVQNASVSGGTTLVADVAPPGHITYVWRFDGKLFTRLGTLAVHSTPGTGNYVLANEVDGDDTQASLPSLFLTIV